MIRHQQRSSQGSLAMPYLPDDPDAAPYRPTQDQGAPTSPTSDNSSTTHTSAHKSAQSERATDAIMLNELGSQSVGANTNLQGLVGNEDGEAVIGANAHQYRLYKRRFAGLVAIMVLNCAGGMNWPWFGPIANDTSATFGISLDEVNWLGNIIALTYLVAAPLVPIVCMKYGLRVSYTLGSVFLLAGAWVRYAGTAKSLDSKGAYALLIIGQFLGAVSQAIFQVLAPTFSETWFDLKGRTTATMLMSIANPVGGALGQLISPLITGVRSSVLVLGIISTVASPFCFLVGAQPPTPPSYSGSQPTPHFITTLRAIVGLLPRPPPHAEVHGAKGTPVNIDHAEDTYMTLRERFDFFILFMIFGVLVSGTNTFALLSNEILEPYGYSDDTAGFMGAALLLSGIVAAIVTSPLFDRVFTHHLGLAARIFAPIIAVCWFSLIWAVKPTNTAALYALFVLIGVFSVSMLPVGLEMGCELTRNSSASAAILWWSGNLFGIILVLVMSALRAPESASPPQNMHRALIFNGVTILAVTASIFLFHGRQRRREKDLYILNAGLLNDSSTATGVEPEQGGHFIALRHRVKGQRSARVSDDAVREPDGGDMGGRGRESDVEAVYDEDGKDKVEKGGTRSDIS